MIIRKINNLYIIKILNKKEKKYNLFDKNQIKELFQEIIQKIKKKYPLDGFLDINVYVNEYYGLIIEIEQIYSDSQEIDMQIHFHLNSIFLNEINEFEFANKKEIYYYNQKFYSIYDGLIDSNIIYKTDDFLEHCIKITK